MSLLHDDSFLAHFELSKASAKQQVNSMIDAIYAKVLLDLELWLNKHDRHDSVHGIGLNHNEPTGVQRQFMSTNTQQMHQIVNCPPSNFLSNDSIKSEIDFDCEENVTDHNLPGESSNDYLTNTHDHQNNLQNEVSLSNTITTESMIKQELDDDQEESSRPVKRQRMDTTQSHNAIHIMQEVDCQYGNGGQTIEGGHGQAMNTQFEDSQSTCPINSNLNCEENVPVPNLPVESPSCHDLIRHEYNRMCTETSPNGANTSPNGHQQIFDLSQHLLTPYVPQQTHSITFHDEIDDEEESENVNNNEVGRMGNEAIDTLSTIGEYSGDYSDEAMVIPEGIGEVSNCLLQNELTQQPNVQQMHFEEIPQEILDEVKREIEEEEEMKRKENKHEDGDEKHDKVDRVGSELSEAIYTRPTIEYFDHGQHNSEEFMVIQQEERDANNAIGEEISTISSSNPIQPNIAQFQCPHCPKSFVIRSLLHSHLPVHTDKRSFQCDQCDKSFKHVFNLTKHQLIHQNIKRFRCDQCEKQFTQKNHLDAHLRTHSGERPFTCRHCDQSFTQINARNTHEQGIHLHVKPYRCKQCGHTASQRSHLINHIRIVHFGLPKTIKQQRALNIIDDRDPRELVEKV